MKDLRVFTVVPAAASFATPYSSGDVIGGLNTISHGVLNDGGAGILQSLTVIDLANQKSAIDIIFFDQAPANSFGADNAAYALNDADAAKILGRVSVAGADYVSSGTTNAEATERNLILVLQAIAKSKDLFFVVVSRGTPTYGAATDLKIRLGIAQ